MVVNCVLLLFQPQLVCSSWVLVKHLRILTRLCYYVVREPYVNGKIQQTVWLSAIFCHLLSLRIFDRAEKALNGVSRQLFTIRTIKCTFMVWDVFMLAQVGIMFSFGGKNSKTSVPQSTKTLLSQCAFLALPLAEAKACHYDQLAYRVDLWLNLLCALLCGTSAGTTTCMQVVCIEQMR